MYSEVPHEKRNGKRAPLTSEHAKFTKSLPAMRLVSRPNLILNPLGSAVRIRKRPSAWRKEFFNNVSNFVRGLF